MVGQSVQRDQAGEFKGSKGWCWRKQERTKGKVDDGEAEGLETEMVSRGVLSGGLWLVDS